MCTKKFKFPINFDYFRILFQLLARLVAKPSLRSLDPVLLPDEGLKPGEVLEIYGESSSGKTQCLLHWLATCLLPASWNEVTLGGLGIGVVFMDNDSRFSMIRLVGMMEARVATAMERSDQSVPSEETMEEMIKTCLENLKLVRCSSSLQFAMTLFSLESLLSNHSKISIIMIDSISAFFWIDRNSGGDSIMLQEKNLSVACSALETLIKTYQISVIATKTALFLKKTAPHADSSGEIIAICVN